MRSLLTPLLLLLVVGLGFTGDVATFENLGFNDGGRVFVFGQYGLRSEGATPFADIFAVDVPGNRFLANGVFTVSSDAPIVLGQDGRGAFYTAFARAQPLLSREGVNHFQTGRLIYFLADRNASPARLGFRDFNTQSRYDIVLRQSNRGSGSSVSAEFHIEMTRSVNNATRTYTIGRPGFFRDGVESYRIAQVIVGPDEASIVIVVERLSPDGSIRYMVETTRL